MAVSLIVFLGEKPKVYSPNQPPRSSIEHLFNWGEGAKEDSNFFSLKWIYLLFEILLPKNFGFGWNLDFLCPNEISKIASNTAILFRDRVWGEWVQRLLRRLPRKLKISLLLISLKVVQYTFEKCAETPSRSSISCCSNIPYLKKEILYNLLTMIGHYITLSHLRS